MGSAASAVKAVNEATTEQLSQAIAELSPEERQRIQDVLTASAAKKQPEAEQEKSEKKSEQTEASLDTKSSGDCKTKACHRAKHGYNGSDDETGFSSFLPHEVCKDLDSIARHVSQTFPDAIGFTCHPLFQKEDSCFVKAVMSYTTFSPTRESWPLYLWSAEQAAREPDADKEKTEKTEKTDASVDKKSCGGSSTKTYHKAKHGYNGSDDETGFSSLLPHEACKDLDSIARHVSHTFPDAIGFTCHPLFQKEDSCLVKAVMSYTTFSPTNESWPLYLWSAERAAREPEADKEKTEQLKEESSSATALADLECNCDMDFGVHRNSCPRCGCD